MADTTEQKIIGQVVARMQTISISNGYHTDIGANVRDSETHWDESQLPAVSVFEGRVVSTEMDEEGYYVERTLPVMLKCFLQRLDTSAADAAFARKVNADMYRAICLDDKWIVAGIPLAMYTLEVAHGIEYAPDSFEVTGCQVEIEIHYHGSKFNLEG